MSLYSWGPSTGFLYFTLFYNNNFGFVFSLLLSFMFLLITSIIVIFLYENDVFYAIMIKFKEIFNNCIMLIKHDYVFIANYVTIMFSLVYLTTNNFLLSLLIDCIALSVLMLAKYQFEIK